MFSVLFKDLRENERPTSGKTFDMNSKRTGFKSQLENRLPSLTCVVVFRARRGPDQCSVLTQTRSASCASLSSTNCMELGPSWEANSTLSQSRNSRILWKSKVRYGVHKNRPPFPIPSHMNPIETPKPYFPEVHFNIIFPSTIRSSELYLS
jgi:hypothetical protein